MRFNQTPILLFAALFVLMGTQSFFAQKVEKAAAVAAKPSPILHSSPAYAELLLRRTDLNSELESLALEYTEEYPRVKEIRHVLTLVDRDVTRLTKVTDANRLTLALGKLMTRKIELETDLWKLQGNYKDEHPEVKRAKRKVEIYEKAVGEILN